MPILRPALALTASLVAVLGTAAAVPALADKPGDTDTTKTSKGTQTRTCSGGTVKLAGPQVLFPPNHKMVDETGSAVSSNPGAFTTTVTLNAATIEDVSGGDGSPTEGPDSSGASMGSDTDGDGTAAAPYQVRAERSGKGDGRTYTIAWSAMFRDGSSCSSSDNGQTPFILTVPHDQGNNPA